jgi:hypothetical protein
MSLQMDEMLRDANLAWKYHDQLSLPGMLLGDMACHVRALAAEVDRLRASHRDLLWAVRTIRALAVPGMDWAGEIGREVLGMADDAIARAKGGGR